MKAFSKKSRKNITKLLCNIFGVDIFYKVEHRWNPFKRNYVRVRYGYVDKVRIFFTIIWKKILQGLIRVFLGLMSFGAVTGITAPFSSMLEPVVRRMRKSKSQIREEELGIEYHKVTPSYSIEQLREIMLLKKGNMEAAQQEAEYLLENYIVETEYDGWKVQVKRNTDPEMSPMWIIDLEGKLFSIIMGTKNELLEDDRRENEIMPDGLREFLDKDISEITGQQNYKGMTFLEFAIHEFKSIKPPKKKEMRGEVMTPEMMQEVIDEITFLQSISTDGKQLYTERDEDKATDRKREERSRGHTEQGGNDVQTETQSDSVNEE